MQKLLVNNEDLLYIHPRGIYIMKKICSRCKVEKDLSEFYSDKRNKDGKRSECKVCTKEYDKKYYVDNPEKHKARNKKWHAANPEKCKASVKKWQNNKRKNDSGYRLKNDIHSLFNNNLRKQIKKPTDLIFKHTYTSFNDYIEHLKKSEHWDKYVAEDKNIQLDHIIPQSSYNFTESAYHILQCWDLRNLQLLTKDDNKDKGTKLDMALVKELGIEHLLPGDTCDF